MRSLGQLCLLAAFVGTGYSACASVAGWRSGRRLLRRTGLAAGLASGVALSVAVAALVYGLLLKDFRFAYVAQYSSRLLPWHYSVSSLWVGQAGSLLLWSWMSMALALVFRCGPRRQPLADSLREPAFGVLMAFCCFLVATMVFAADPLAANLMPADDGAGLSPILQHPSMLIHPPIVFLGYAAWSIPFAVAITALATGRLDASWAREARPWALLAWTVLGAGILIGAHWAYEELGWGGYWGWDPVENGSLIPWLLGTSAIHTTMAWRRRGMLKKTALGLTVATFAMCNFATFLTRSGIFSSLHAFSRSPIGWLFLGLLLLMALPTVYWTIVRRRSLAAERAVPTLWCRESMVIVSTLALVGLTLVICGGTLSTAISSATIGRKIVVGIAFYNNALIPTGLLILLATAAAPLLRWGGEPTPAQRRLLGISAAAGCTGLLACWLLGVRHPLQALVAGLACFAVVSLASAVWLDARGLSTNLIAGLLRTLQTRRQQYAGFVIHLGLFCLAVGVVASSLSTRRHETVMREGDSIVWQGRRVRLARITQTELPDKLVVAAHLEIHDRSGRLIHLAPAQHFHVRQNEWTTEVGIHAGWRGDLYTILHHAEAADGVRLSLIDNPMMGWIWLGGWVMGLGALTAVWPKIEIRKSNSETNWKSKIRMSNTTRDGMMQTAAATRFLSNALPAVCLLVLVLVVTVAVTVVAPVDVAMGQSQRIVYVHVSMAWSSLWLFVVMAASGIQYLRHRDSRWDAWSYAAAELGWLCCSLTLVTGSFWAHEAWGTWWTWDPRLTTSFILWLIYCGVLLARHGDTNRHRGARISAVLAAVGLLDLPFVTMATRWFRGMHPISPQMEPSMRVVLAVTVGCFTAFFVLLLVRRQRQLRHEFDWIREFADLETPLAADNRTRQYTDQKGAA